MSSATRASTARGRSSTAQRFGDPARSDQYALRPGESSGPEPTVVRSRADHSRAPRSRAARTTGAPLLRRTPRRLPTAAVVLGPTLGALLGKAIGGYHGPVFALLTIAAAALAAAAATPSGRWWVVPALPPVAWLVAAAAELAWHNPPYAGSKAEAVGLVHATTRVFPVTLAALAVMGLVIAATTLRGRLPRGRRV
ncbi:MAG: hypothetical protein ACJ786_30140 [Catenulispora sp.]